MINFSERSKHSTNPTATHLFDLMARKETNLCASADLTKAEDVLHLAEQIGQEICLLKTHVDVIEDFSEAFHKKLTQLAKQEEFLIFEDRKFADIGNTAKLQYNKGLYHIADWAHITNAHILPGEGIINGLKEVGLPKGNGLLLLAQMSSKDNLIDNIYTETAIRMAEKNNDFVIGFICQQKLTDKPEFIHMTPGISIASKEDALSQQYTTPEKAILENGTDVIIVGRGIYDAKDPLASAKIYRKQAWGAYKKRCLAYEA